MAPLSNRTKHLKTTFAYAEALSRPIITYINGDVSWLVSFPRPRSEKSTTGKVYYHAVIDPWFGQPSVFISTYVLEMELGRNPGLPNRAAIDEAIVEIEDAAGNTLVPTDADPAVDAIFIMGQAEHCNKDSLLQFSASTPMFAIPASASNIAAWNHFDTLVTLSAFDPSKKPWKEGHPGSSLPAWLTVFSPAVSKINNFGLVLINTANLPGELILMSPHGISADESSVKGLIETKIPMLALFSPLKDSFALGIKTVMNVEDSLAITHAAGTRYFVRSGDFESLKYKGIIGWTVRDVPHDLSWGVEQFNEKVRDGKTIEPPTLVEVENGGSFVLM